MKNKIFPAVLILPLFLLLLSITSCFESPKEIEEEKVILGIFGGMGPEATADLYRQIVGLTPAQKDQDHIPTLIYSQPQIPDRMSSIRNQDMTVIPYLVEGVTRLENAGASFIAIPCNTVHYFYDYMQEAVSIPVIHMIRETVKEVIKKYPGIKTVGLLATTGTIETRLYEDELVKNGFKLVVPDEETETNKVMKAIFQIKSGTDKKLSEDLLAEAGQYVIDQGAELIILGCTEIPLAFNPTRVNVPVVNATKVLAERAIKMYQDLNLGQSN